MRAGLPLNPSISPTAARSEPRRDLDCLTQAVYYEARGESAGRSSGGRPGGAQPRASSGLPQIGLRRGVPGAAGGYGCQFSFACDGSMRDRREPAAWRRARGSRRPRAGRGGDGGGRQRHPLPCGRLGSRLGAGLIRVAQVGLHVFYRFGGGAGRPGASMARRNIRPREQAGSQPAQRGWRADRTVHPGQRHDRSAGARNIRVRPPRQATTPEATGAEPGREKAEPAPRRPPPRLQAPGRGFLILRRRRACRRKTACATAVLWARSRAKEAAHDPVDRHRA